MIYNNKKLRQIFQTTFREEKGQQSRDRRSFPRKAGLGQVRELRKYHG